MNWQDIDGWFNQEDGEFYAKIAQELPNPARILEIGAYKGRSTACLDHHCKLLGKDVTIDVIDLFTGDKGVLGIMPSYLEEFTINTSHCNIGRVIIEDTATAHRHLDCTYDFIFIDASHDYDSVVADITNYKPFLAPNGILAGHDAFWDSVNIALGHMNIRYQIHGDCWRELPCLP
jgi:predicted O-methyltransferase YrrM